MVNHHFIYKVSQRFSDMENDNHNLMNCSQSAKNIDDEILKNDPL